MTTIPPYTGPGHLNPFVTERACPLRRAHHAAHGGLFFRDGFFCTSAVDGFSERLGTGTTAIVTTCSRCNGLGVWSARPGYTCYQCGGQRKYVKTHKVYTAAKLAKLNAAGERRQLAREAAATARVAAEAARRDERAAQMEADYPGLAARIASAAEDERGGRFMESMATAIGAYGGLTTAQANAALKAIDRAAADRELPYVGTVGARRDFDTEVVYATSWQGSYGTTYMHILRDLETGGTLVYKGSCYLLDRPMAEARGVRVTLKATIAEHSERDGKRQTVLKRPAGVAVAQSETTGGD